MRRWRLLVAAARRDDARANHGSQLLNCYLSGDRQKVLVVRRRDSPLGRTELQLSKRENRYVSARQHQSFRGSRAMGVIGKLLNMLELQCDPQFARDRMQYLPLHSNGKLPEHLEVESQGA